MANDVGNLFSTKVPNTANSTCNKPVQIDANTSALLPPDDCKFITGSAPVRAREMMFDRKMCCHSLSKIETTK